MIFKTFKSGIGDCIFLLLKEDETQFSIMIDCGSYKVNKAIKQFVKDELGLIIDLLIITHIDNDHIIGVRDMLTESGLSVKKIVFNCYQRKGDSGVRKLNQIQKERFADIEKEIGLIVGDIVEQDVAAPDAMKGVAATILANPDLKRVWGKNYTVRGDSIALNEWGKITFLSPTMDELEALDKEFRHVLFDELNVDKTMGTWKDKENMFEILLRYTMLHYPPEDDALEKDVQGMLTLEDRLKKAAAQPVDTRKITPSNQASLAFVWEKDDRRILMLGDANPDVIVKGIMNHYKGRVLPVLFDAIKVSHHGSHFNTTPELMRYIDSRHFFFTGGVKEKRPSEEAVGRIVLEPLPKGINQRTLHFNYSNTLVEELRKDKDLQNKYNFRIDTKKNEMVFTI